jgi:hypothetical protein
MQRGAVPWQTIARNRAVEQFGWAWRQAPPAGRQALVEAAIKDRIGHRWETGTRACVLALLVAPVLRPGEKPKAGAYRMFGSVVTDDFPATWDASGVTRAELLASVGIHLPEQRPHGPVQRIFHRLTAWWPGAVQSPYERQGV